MNGTDIKIVIAVIIILVAQGTWIFQDANKRGENKWLWGLFGLIQMPSSLIIYLIVTRRYTNQIICPHCLYSIKHDSKYCNYCGHAISDEERITGKIKKKKDEYHNK